MLDKTEPNKDKTEIIVFGSKAKRISISRHLNSENQ